VLAAMGAEVTVWDDKPAAREAATGLVVAEPDVHAIDALILSPGIPHLLPKPHPVAVAAREAGVPILSMPICFTARCARRDRRRVSSASPAPTANRPPRPSSPISWPKPGFRRQPAQSRRGVAIARPAAG